MEIIENMTDNGTGKGMMKCKYLSSRDVNEQRKINGSNYVKKKRIIMLKRSVKTSLWK